MINSALPGFGTKTVDERISAMVEAGGVGLSQEDISLLRKSMNVLGEQVTDKRGRTRPKADLAIENVIGTVELPLAVATNFKINGTDFLIPMAVEEPSIVAGASGMAKIARDNGGFTAKYSGDIMDGHTNLIDVPDMRVAINRINENTEDLLKIANHDNDKCANAEHDLGPNCKTRTHTHATAIECEELEIRPDGDRPAYKQLIVKLFVNVGNAMGANIINEMVETLSHPLEQLTGGVCNIRILSNAPTYRTVSAEATFDKEQLAILSPPKKFFEKRGVPKKFEGHYEILGEEGDKIRLRLDPDILVDHIIFANDFADAYPKRAATHNKGIMNAIDPIAIATGQDWRALEAGAHTSPILKKGRYGTLTSYSKDENGNLVGRIDLAIQVGTAGASIKTNPITGLSIKILGGESLNAATLSMVMASAGLAQNVAALRSLAGLGIQTAHMPFHLRKG